MAKRYQMVLIECPATNRHSWGKVLFEADSLKGLWDITGWSPMYIDYEQKWQVNDTLRNKIISASEYYDLISSMVDKWTKT